MKLQKAMIYDYLTGVAQVFRDQKITSEALAVYAEMLSEELTLEEIKMGLKTILKTKKEPFFPSIAEIIEASRPKLNVTEQANLLAAEIINCISKYGPYQTDAVKAHLGAMYSVVESFGWQSLCMITNDEVPAVRAQIREVAKAHLTAKSKGLFVNISALGDPKRELVKINLDSLQINQK